MKCPQMDSPDFSTCKCHKRDTSKQHIPLFLLWAKKTKLYPFQGSMYQKPPNLIQYFSDLHAPFKPRYTSQSLLDNHCTHSKVAKSRALQGLVCTESLYLGISCSLTAQNPVLTPPSKSFLYPDVTIKLKPHAIRVILRYFTISNQFLAYLPS